MFTGIIEEIGNLTQIKRQSQTLQLVIKAKTALQDIKLGDSIAVNGVCLTVTSFNKTEFTADVMPVTFNTTTLSSLSSGAEINLERAMAANGRFGGHIVSGHIDGIGVISSRISVENAILYSITLHSNLAQLCIAKGSIAIDGTSLTIVDCGKNWVQVSLIPHTQKESIWSNKKVGEKVNIECDILSKQINKISQQHSSINEGFLRENGFLI
jgi:riboflavin synthase